MPGRSALLMTAALLLATGVPSPAPAAEANTTAPARPRAPAVTVTPAARRELVETLVVTGSLLPREEVVVGVDIDGLKIIELGADQGDRVTAGQVIARLSPEVIETLLAQNQSSLAWADASIAQARAQIAQAEAAQAESDAALERAKPLREKGVISQDVLEQRLAAARANEARTAAARQGLMLAEADRKMKEASRTELELRLRKTEIKAPTAGLVLTRTAKIGAVAGSAGEPLFRIARDGKIELDAQVAETSLHRLKVGQKVEVTPAGFDKPVVGTIRLVAPQVDPASRLGNVRVELPTDETLRSGSFGRGRVELARREGIAVPRSAIFVDRGGPTVQVVKDGKVETRRIETGMTGEGRVEVTSGLAEGELVITKAGTFVRDGDEVNPVVAKAQEIDG